jgi:hypothetical protein
MRPIIAVSLILFLCACGREEPEPVTSQQAAPVTDWRLLVQLPDVTLPVRLHLAADGRVSPRSTTACNSAVTAISFPDH